MTFAAPLRVNVELIVKETGEVKEQELFMGDFPLMTPNGTFIINGAERVVVSQLVRSPGVYFTREKDPTTGRDLAYAKLIPNRGAWLEFETSNRDVISVKVDRKRKIPVTTLLRAIDTSRGRARTRSSAPPSASSTWFAGRRRQPGPPLHRDDDREGDARGQDRQQAARARASTSACAPATRRRWRTRAAC